MDWQPVRGKSRLFRPYLTSLTLQGVCLEYVHILLLFDFPSLTGLTLLHCEQFEEFIPLLGTETENHMLQLQHLTLDMFAAKEENDMDSFEECLNELLRHHYGISSLHLGWWDHRIQPARIPCEIITSGHLLRSLGLCQHYFEEDVLEWDTLNTHDFRLICRSCPNLLQLGYQLANDDVFATRSQSNGYDNFMVSQ
jgi:hypothetical protein